MFLRTISMIAVAAVLAAGAPACAQTAAQGALLERALDAATAGDWPEAETLARRTGSKVAADLVTWVRLRDGAGDWDDYQRFLELHADWPGLAAMRRSAERQMPSGQAPEAVFAFFAGEPPQTATGSLRLAEALATSGREPEAEAEIVRAWRDYSMTGPERQAVMARWKAVLAPHHEARLDMLLWRGLTGEAQAMLPLVDADQAALAPRPHRGAPRRGGAAVPDQPGAGRASGTTPASPSSATSTASTSAAGRRPRTTCARSRPRPRRSGRPELWLERRANLARQALEDGQVEAAYEIAAKNFGSGGRRIRRLRVGRGLHRADADGRSDAGGRAFRALPGRGGDPDQPRARRLLARPRPRGGRQPRGGAGRLPGRGASNQTSFYGQLAAAEVGLPPDPR